MSSVHWSLQWGQFLSLLLAILSIVIAEDCIVPKAFPHYVTVDMNEVDTRMCYKCYGAPTKQGFQVILHELRLGGLGSVMMYVDGSPRRFTEDCGECETENFIEVDENGGLNTKADAQCHECDAVPNGTLVELYIRLNAQAQAPSEEDDLCQNLPSIFPNFNLSLNINTNKQQDLETSPDCDDGYSVNFPTSGDTCVVNSTYSVGETHCVVPTCPAGSSLSLDVSNEKIEHKFLLSSPPETCIWQLDTEQRKHLTLKYSENIRPHLTVYEESLSNPKWDIEWCPSFSNEFRFETESSVIYLVYRNSKKLSKKGSLSLSAQADLCLLPPKLDNGNVEFKHLDSGTVAYYSCDKGFTLLGQTQLRCKSRAWDKAPICLPIDEDKLMSDAPMGSVHILESVNGSVLISENGTSLAIDTDEMGKTPDTMLDMEDSGDEPEEDDYENEKEFKKYMKEMFEAEDGIVSNGTSLDNVDDYNDRVFDIIAINGSLDDMSVRVNGSDKRSFDIILKLFNLSMEDDMALYLIIGACGLLVIIVILIIALIVYRKKYPVRLGLGRKFDTFQNPIYEKTVVQMPMQIEETEVGKEKSDGEEISDCTVLE